MSKPSFWGAFLSPARATEAVHWIKKYPDATRDARGDHGETALHWGAQSSLSLMTDLINLGIPTNATDQHGKTPQDWQNDRLFFTCIDPKVSLSAGGRLRVRKESELMIQALWGLGGRPGLANPVEPLQIWARAGLWGLVDMRRGLRTMKWKDLGDRRESLLHGWILAPDTPEKERRLEQALTEGQLSVNEPDRDSRSPLWMAVDGWLSRPAYARTLEPAIQALLAKGADSALPDRFGVSPQDLAKNGDTPTHQAVRAALGMTLAA